MEMEKAHKLLKNLLYHPVDNKPLRTHIQLIANAHNPNDHRLAQRILRFE